MTYSLDATVVEIKADFGLFGDQYVQVSFGYKLPVSISPPQPNIIQSEPVFYKHVAHIFIPKDKWIGQFTMWESCKVTVEDNGNVSIKKVGPL